MPSAWQSSDRRPRVGAVRDVVGARDGVGADAADVLVATGTCEVVWTVLTGFFAAGRAGAPVVAEPAPPPQPHRTTAANSRTRAAITYSPAISS